jgi:RNA polymerase sigma-70 factor (ECF subfamily)
MSEDAPSDDELIARSQRGDTRGFAQLVKRYQDYMHNAVVHLVGPGEDAEDLTQEVFMKAYRGIDGFKGRSRFSTWLYGIMLNCVRSHWRRQGRGPDVVSLEAGGDEDSSPPDPPDQSAAGPMQQVLRQERVEVVRRCIRKLSPTLREVLVLRDLQGLPYADLAESLDVPLGTVKSRLARARNALRDEIQPILGDQF